MARWTDKPWERQNGESEKAYEAFAIYRDMGDGRTFSAVAERLHKSYTLIRRWKAAWEWEKRVRAYDNDLEKKAHAKAVKDRKDMTDRHIDIAMRLQEKALEALKSLDAEDMTPKDIKEFLKMATDLERLNRTPEVENATNATDSEVLAAWAEKVKSMREEGKDG